MADEIDADASLREARIRRVTAFIWLVGLLTAAVIFVSNGPVRDDAGEYRAQDSKIYVREAEKWGGKGELLLEDIDQTFASFWHGRRLALTVLGLTALVSFSYRFVAR